MNVKTMTIPFDNEMTVSFNKEDGLPQISFESNGSSFTIGTHNKFNAKILREMATSLVALADSITPKNDEKYFIISCNDGNPDAPDEDRIFISEYDEYSVGHTQYKYRAKLFTENEALKIVKEMENYNPKIYFKCSVFPREIGDIKYSLDYWASGNIEMFSSIPEDILHKWNLYNRVLQKIETYSESKHEYWNWSAQSIQVDFFIEMKYDEHCVFSDVCFCFIDILKDGLPHLALSFPSYACDGKYWFIYDDKNLTVNDLEKIIGVGDYTIYESTEEEYEVTELLVTSNSDEFKSYMEEKFHIILDSDY